MTRKLMTILALIVVAIIFNSASCAMAAKIRVLFVGGDWKSQLPAYTSQTRTAKGVVTTTRPLRGYFIRKLLHHVAPGRFALTLWTNYQFLQYGDAQSLKQFDVIVCGGLPGESIMPRLVTGIKAFVKGGGGLMYADSYKNFISYRRRWSFNAVLPIEQVPFQPYGPGHSQPFLSGPIKLQVVQAQNPIMRGLNFATAPALLGAHYGQVKKGAVVLAKGPKGTPLWVEWSYGKGRVLYPGGVFSNDDYSRNFANWPQFGKFYAQALSWLAGHCTYPEVKPADAVATGTLRVNFNQPGPAVTAALFGIHASEDVPRENAAAQRLFAALHLNGAFARTSAFAAIKPRPHGKQAQFMRDGVNLNSFDWSKYNFKSGDQTWADIKKIHEVPDFLYWMPFGQRPLNPGIWTKYVAAAIQHYNVGPGTSGLAGYKPRLKYIELMNEPALGPPTSVLAKYCRFFNYIAGHLHQRYPGLLFGGCGGYEYPYDDQVIARCCKNGDMNWISRHPYGLTGQAVFWLQDKYMRYAKSIGVKNLKFFITEWDFWLYGNPSFDYLMQRWQPVVKHAGSLIGTLQYRWTQYSEGGYEFGMIGGWGSGGQQMPPQWPMPGISKPLTYKYDAFWIMRNCRGTQYSAQLNVPALKTTPSQYAYAVATSNQKQLNIVIYYGYPYTQVDQQKRYAAIHVHIHVPVPSWIKGRTLIIARANARTISTAAPVQIQGNSINMAVTVPALSAVSLTVK